MKKTFILLLTCLIVNAVAAQIVQKETVYFGFDKFKINNTINDQLTESINKINPESIIQIEITGHTDSDGNEGYNQSLSNKRAMEVYNFFLNNGIVEGKLQMTYSGEKKPIALNNNKMNKSKNRRVEILIEYIDSEKEAFNTKMRAFTVSFDEYLINPKLDTMIILDNKGTILHIPKNCFVDATGELIQETVNLKYREFKNSADMAFSKIPMMYDEESFFNSSGMFEIEGNANGKPVNIAAQKQIVIDYALAKQNPDIQFFNLNEVNQKWEKVQEIEPINLKINNSDIETKKVWVDGNLVQEQEWVDGELVKDNNWNAEFWENAQDSVFVDTAFFNNRQNFQPLIIEDDGNRDSGTLLAEGMNVGHTYPAIIKGLNIDNFGVYNCDQIYRVKDRVSIAAKYIDKEGQTIKSASVLSMIDLNYNGAFSFAPRQFICSATGENALVLFTKKGKIYLLDKEQFKEMNIKKSGEYIFTMKDMTEEIKNTDDLATYLGIDM